MHPEAEITVDRFLESDLRIGSITRAEDFPQAHRPAIKLWIDFGPLGVLKSSAQITDLYEPDTLVGKQVIAVVNLPARQIGNFMSQCLVLGIPSDSGVSLLSPDHPLPNGSRVS